MSSAYDRRAIDRFVAGLPVDEDAIAAAIATQAIDRTIVVESLLRALEHPDAVVRLRTAQRVARMDHVVPPVAARLKVIAATDVDLRARAAGAAALLAHGEPVPGEAKPSRVAESAAPVLASLWFRRLVLRSTPRSAITLAASDVVIAPDAGARVTVGEDGLLRIELWGLPPDFSGTRPTARARTGHAGESTDVATAAQPVTADGSVTIDVGPEAGPVAAVEGWLATGLEVVVRAD